MSVSCSNVPENRSAFPYFIADSQIWLMTVYDKDSMTDLSPAEKHRIEPISVPGVDPDFVRETREALHMSRQVFAFKIGVKPRTLERGEQGRSKPNEQASALIRLVRKYPDTLERLESLSVPS